MRCDFTVAITDLRGRCFHEDGSLWKEDSNGEKLTAARIVAVALNNGAFEEKDFEKAMKRYDLMKKIELADGPVDLSAADVILIQRVLPSVWSPLFVGQLNELMEPAQKKEG